MQHYKGQFNEAVVFTDSIEHSAVAQVHRFIDHPAFAGGRIRVMPDVHYGSIWLVIHSGSRKLGMEIAKFHQRVAVERVGKMGGLEYLEGDDRERYIRDMKIAQHYARLNRRVVALELMKFFASDDIDTLKHVESVHNYIDFGAGIIRKGAISAQAGESVIIPLHLAAGCIIGTGKGLEDWNFSAPHGAGRVLARGEAKRTLDVEHYRGVVRKSGVWTTCVNKGTLDESPMAYRKPKQILADLEGIIDVKEVMKPIYVYKDGSQE